MTLLAAAGNALSIPLASGSAQLVAGSPPYLALRRYGKAGDETPAGAAWMDWPPVEWSPMPGEPMRTAPPWRGQLGHEPDPGLYAAHLVAIGREVWRVLHETGVFWINIGTTYSGGGGGNYNPESKSAKNRQVQPTNFKNGPAQGGASQDQLIPHRVALALQADGWILRSAVTWSSNRLPESVAGWSWQRCRVKVAGKMRAASDYHDAVVGGPLSGGTQGGDVGGNRAATWQPCPGCPKCEPTGGYVLRRGSWRPTRSVEMVFMFAKGPGYWASGERVREASIGKKPGLHHGGGAGPGSVAYLAAGSATHGAGSSTLGLDPKANRAAGRNLRDVWRPELTAEERDAALLEIGRRVVEESAGECPDLWYIPTEPSRLAHYAGWPSALVRKMIQSSTPDAGCCRDCGVPWSEVVERERLLDGQPAERGNWDRHHGRTLGGDRAPDGLQAVGHWRFSSRSNVLGWLPSCACNPLPPIPLIAGAARQLTRPALVIDPFGGTGVTAREARAMGRSAVSVDPILDYCQMARDNAAEGCIVARQERPRQLATIEGPLFRCEVASP